MGITVLLNFQLMSLCRSIPAYYLKHTHTHTRTNTHIYIHTVF